MANLAFALADNANKNDYINNCMIAKGYALVDKNSVPSAASSPSFAHASPASALLDKNEVRLAAPESPHSTFDEQDFAQYAAAGTSSIVGQAFLKTRGGDVKLGAGNEVLLCPVTPYSTEYFERQVVREEQLQPPDERILRYFKSTVADASGRFEFKNLPAGEYFLGCKITWEVQGVAGTETVGGAAYARVRVDSGEVAKVILTRRP